MDDKPVISIKGRRTKMQAIGDWQENVTSNFSHLFYRLGYTVATYRWRTIIISWIFVGICSIGFLRFHIEKNPLKLWVPQDSKFLQDTNWLMKSFGEGYRLEHVLITAPNVLEASVLAKLAVVSKSITEITAKFSNGTNIKLEDLCFKIPFITQYADLQQMYSVQMITNILNITRPFNPSIDIPSDFYCSLIDDLPLGCMLENLLELWKFDEKVIAKLSQNEIIDAVNTIKQSPYTGHDVDFTKLLGDVTQNITGHIIEARSLLSRWMVYVNFSNLNSDDTGNIAGTEDWASEESLLWENEFLQYMRNASEIFSNNEVEIFYAAGRSFGDISSATMFQAMHRIVIGIIIMFTFMVIVLSKYSRIELRFQLASIGLLGVGMAFICSVALCSIAGISYGPVHSSLPFLLMGLGVDDIFVLMASWRQVQNHHKDKTIEERIGLMLKHAGVSITVTSITDMVAFLVGASTFIPSLNSFCLFAATGVFCIYLFTLTFVVAVFTLDEYRIKENRCAFIPCITHKAPDAKKICWEPNIMANSLHFAYKNFILTKYGKIILLTLAVCVTGISIESLLKLRQKFDPKWFIPERTYLYEYIEEKEQFYPDLGYEAMILIGKINYTEELPKIVQIVKMTENHTDIVHHIQSWTEPFHDFVQIYYNKSIIHQVLTDFEWRNYLSKFLFSSAGGKFQANFRFDEKLECGNPTGNVTVSSIGFQYKTFDERYDYVPAMYKMADIVRSVNISSGDAYSTVWAKAYGNWITDEIIDTEVIRNICLAFICVMICTTVLILNVYICFWIFMCVLLTLINVCGFMERWNLTIDLISCIGLELAVGLCVDYAAHVGHTFLTTTKGDRNERVLHTIEHIGAAVIYGASSTLLALLMLIDSEAYTFRAFLKIFFLVIVFGLFFGLVFLPIVLSLIGPSPYRSSDDDVDEERKTNDRLLKDIEIVTIVQKQTNEKGDKGDPLLNNDNDNKI